MPTCRPKTYPYKDSYIETIIRNPETVGCFGYRKVLQYVRFLQPVLSVQASWLLACIQRVMKGVLRAFQLDLQEFSHGAREFSTGARIVDKGTEVGFVFLFHRVSAFSREVWESKNWVVV